MYPEDDPRRPERALAYEKPPALDDMAAGGLGEVAGFAALALSMYCLFQKSKYFAWAALQLGVYSFCNGKAGDSFTPLSFSLMAVVSSYVNELFGPGGPYAAAKAAE